MKKKSLLNCMFSILLFFSILLPACNDSSKIDKTESTKNQFQGLYSATGSNGKDDKKPAYVSGNLIVKLKEATVVADYSSKSSTVVKNIPVINKSEKYHFQLKGIVNKESLITVYESKNPQAKQLSQSSILSKSLNSMTSKKRELTKLYKTAIPEGLTAEEAMSILRKDPAVEYVQRNNIYYASYFPDDTLYGQQWSHKSSRAEEAWDIEQGESSIVIAVIDTGVDYNHEDLASNIWTDENGNPGKDFVNTDTDEWANHGYTPIDGEDYTDVDNDPMDFHSHGTHCAGIVAAVDNDKGVVGVAPRCKIMPLRAGFSLVDYNDREVGAFTDDAIINSLIYAADNGANVISMSFGGSSPSTAVQEAITYANDSGATLIAAAGNENSYTFSYPAAYKEVLSVAAIGFDGERSDYSNYGYWVDVAAPGGHGGSNPDRKGILSTVPSRIDATGYAPFSGTSMACPYVAGMAALILSNNNDLTTDQVKMIIKNAVDESKSELYRSTGTGVVNLKKALDLENVPDFKVAITSPEDSQVVNVASDAAQSLLNIRGTATGDSYKLYYTNGLFSNKWKEIFTGTTIATDLLANWNVASLEEDQYVLKLVSEKNGYKKEDYRAFYLGNGFQQGWTDKSFTDIVMNSIAPIYGDLDGDGTVEVIAISSYMVSQTSYNSKSYVFNSDGTPYSSNWPILFDGELKGAAAADLNGDGKSEIVVAGESVIVYNLNGDMLNSVSRIDDINITSLEKPFLADIDGDGLCEIFIKASVGEIYDPRRMDILVFDGNLNLLHRWEMADHFNVDVKVADLDNNGEKELITIVTTDTDTGVETIVKAVDFSGNQIWSEDFTEATYVDIKIADLDSDGKKEVILCKRKSGEFELTVLAFDGKPYNGDGNAIWPVTGDTAGGIIQIANVHGDAKPEIIQMESLYDYSIFNAYDLNGNLVKSFKLEMDEGIYFNGKYALADIDNDGVVDIIGSGVLWASIMERPRIEGQLLAVNWDGEILNGFPKKLHFNNNRSWVGFGAPAVLDLDGDGDTEIISGPGVNIYDYEGTLNKNKIEWLMESVDMLNSDIYQYHTGNIEQTYEQVYLRGSFNNWSVDKPMELVEDYTWQIEINSGAGDSNGGPRFKFDINGDWTLNFGEDNNDFIADANGEDILLESNKTYIITFNDKTKAYSLEKKGEYLKSYDKVYLRGTLNNWDTSKEMELVSDYIWETVVFFKPGAGKGEFKFDIHGDWTLNFGDDNGDNQADLNGDNIQVDRDSHYIIRFNDKTKEYSCEKQSFLKTYDTVYFRGTANGWGTREMNLVGDHKWETIVTFGDWGPKFKFDIYGDWNLNFGDSDIDGIADQGGTDISTTTGRKKITFYDNTKEYTVIDY